MFTINLPVGVLGLAMGFLLLPEFKKDQRTPFDLPSFLSLGVALSLLVFALSNAGASWNTDGWTSAVMLTCFGVSAVGFGLFAIFQSTTAHPLLELSLFRGRDFSISVFLFFIFGFGLFGSDFLLPLYLQNGLGYTPTQAGMVFIPFGVVMILSNVVGGKMNDLVGPQIPGLLGIAVRAYGLYRFTFLTPQSDETEIVLTVCLLAIGMGLMMTPLQTTALAARPKDKAAQASGLVSIARQLGGSFGVAVLSAILVSRDAFHLGALGQGMNAHNPVFQDTVARLSTHGFDAARAQGVIVSHVHTQAFVSGITDVFFIAMVISILSSIPFLFIHSPSRVPQPPVPVPGKSSVIGEKS
jgi:DHA2 family multidrug resistance protein